MSEWLTSIASQFSTLVQNYFALVLMAIALIVLAALAWLWLKIPEGVTEQGAAQGGGLMEKIKSAFTAVREDLAQLIKQFRVVSKREDDLPLYLLLTAEQGESALFTGLPPRKTRRMPSPDLFPLMDKNKQRKLLFHRSLTVIEQALDPQKYEEVEELLQGLNDVRMERPLDGLLIAVPAGVLSDDESVRREFSQTVLNALEGVDSAIPFRLPVYFVISECENLLGFGAYAKQNSQALEQIFGWSNSDSIESDYQSKAIDDAIASVRFDIQRNQIDKSAGQSTLSDVDEFILLDHSISQLAPAIKEIADKLMNGAFYQNGIMFRGLYFVGGNSTQGALGVRAHRVFVSDLLEKKIAMEANLASLTGQGVLSHQQLFKRYKKVSLIGLVSLALWGCFSLFTLSKQLDDVSLSIANLQKITPNDELGYSTVYHVLDDLSRVNANAFYRVAVPASWWGQVDDQLVESISENQFKRIVFPSMECQLGAQFALLVGNPPTVISPLSKQSNAWLYAEAWLSELEQFVKTRGEFIALSKPETRKGTAVLAKFAQLIESLYGIKTPSGFFTRSTLYARALAELEYIYGTGSKDCGYQLTGVDPLSDTAFWKYVDDAGRRFYAAVLASAMSPITPALESQNVPSNTAALDQADSLLLQSNWFDYLANYWVGNSQAPNPCEVMRQRMSILFSKWQDQNRGELNGVSKLSLIRLFQPQNCEAKFYQQLFNSANYVSGVVPFSKTKAGLVTFSSTVNSFRSQFTNVDALPFIGLDTSDMPSASPDTIVWDAKRLQLALSYYKAYKAYAQPHFSDQESGSLNAVVRETQQKLRVAMVYQLKWAMFGKLRSSITQVSTDQEQGLLDRVENFKQVIDQLYELNASLGQLGFETEQDSWQQITRQAALDILGSVDELASLSRLYLPDASPLINESSVLAKLYGIGDAKSLNDYLIRQRERVSYIANNYAKVSVNYLINTASSQGNERGDLSRFEVWKQTLAQLAAYDRKDTTSEVVLLESDFAKALSFNEDACPSAFKVDGGSDLFTQARSTLGTEIIMFCSGSRLDVANQQYTQLLDLFDRHLAGHYPFSNPTDSRSSELSFTVAKSFFESVSSKSDELLTQLNKLVLQDATQYTPALEFIMQLRAIAAFVNLAGAPQGLALDTKFNSGASSGCGSDQVIDQGLYTSSQQVSLLSADQTLAWKPGELLSFFTRIANTSPLQISSANDDVNSIAYTKSGDWALLRFLDAYSVAHSSATYELQIPIAVQARASNRSSTSNQITAPPTVCEKIEMALEVSVSGTDASTQAQTPVTIPTSFPAQSPTLRSLL